MELFARCFLLVFAQLYVGGLLALSVPPFHGIARGFYKSTAAVYLAFGALAFGGRLSLWLEHEAGRPSVPNEPLELLLWLISLVAAAAYLQSLWGKAFRWRARVYATAWLAGVAALALGAQAFRLAPVLSLESVFYPLQLIVGSLLLGAVTTGMLLGHWYLIDRELSIEPFRQLFAFFIALLGAQAVLSGVFVLAILVGGSAASGDSLTRLFDAHRALLTGRLLLSPAAAAGLAWMIWKTLRIPQTMAATGLYYIAILAVLVGEMLGRFILFRTSLPL
jgi:hypothetical protein